MCTVALMYYVPYKTYMEKNVKRQKINTNRKFHTPLDHLAHSLARITYLPPFQRLLL